MSTSSRSKALALVALLIASFLINLETTAVNVALPSLVRELGSSTTQLQWVVDAYNLAFAALLLTFGSLSDRFGRKGMLMSGLAVFGLASIAGGLASTSTELIAARTVMGVGAAMTFPATLSLIRNIYDDRSERARAIGLWGATAGMAIAAGPIFGGWLLEHYSWSSIFYAMGPVAALGLTLAVVAVPTSRDSHDHPIDLPGLALSTLTMATLVYTIIEAPTYGWLAGRSVVGWVAAVVLGSTFIWWEQRVEHPMLDVRLFRNLRFTAASGTVTIAFFTLFGFSFLMTHYFQFVRDYSPLSTGLRLLPIAFSVGIGSVLGTQLAIRLGTKLVVTTGMILITGFYLWVGLSISTTLPYPTIAAQMIVFGLGFGLTSAPATESIMGAVTARQAGIGSAVNDTTRLLGGTLGVAIIGSVASSIFTSRMTDTVPSALPPAAAQAVTESLGSALTVSQQLISAGQAQVAGLLQSAAFEAYVHAVSIGCFVSVGLAAAGALLALTFLPAQPPADLAVLDDEDERDDDVVLTSLAALPTIAN
jgi:EmrB/QacA subfamily drug resistance transporter